MTAPANPPPRHVETPLELAASKPTAAGTGADPRPGIALCLSGGGYRAMLFHAGGLWRLHEVGLLAQVQRVSSVSGGSITAAALALAWQALKSPGADFEASVVGPLRHLADRTIDRRAVVGGLLRPRHSIGDGLAGAYAKHVFAQHTLQDLPATPRFVFNATNLQSTALWRFSRPYARDYRVGEIRAPTIPLAKVVAASSAFPPFLSPVVLEVGEGAYTPNPNDDLHEPPFTTGPILSDGGVYDNLGLETSLSYQTILVSDGGGKIEAQKKVQRNWLGHTIRAMMVIDNQVRSLRKRALMAAYLGGQREGTYWGIRTNIAKYGLNDALPCSPELTDRLAEEPTRLAAVSTGTQKRLINWGYAVCDAALRAHVDPTLIKPNGFPYPSAGVG